VRKLEEELERQALGIEAPKPFDHVTFDCAIELYMLDRAQRGIKDSSGPAVSWSVVETFFRWANSIDIIPSDVSAKRTSLPIVLKQVQQLTQDEMERLLAATSQCGFSPEIVERVRTFILLQRRSGLACIDAATLPRELLRADDNLTQVHRTTTDTEVFIPLPSAVAKTSSTRPVVRM